MTARHAALAGLAFLSFPCVAAEAPASVSLGELKITFTETRLSQIREAVGTGLVDRHAGLAWLCYTVLQELAAQRFWITSAGALEADSFTSEVLAPDERPSPACPALPARFLPVSMENGIWLGMTLAEIERKVGVRAERSGAYFVFVPEGRAGSAHRLVVQLVDNRAVRLWVHKPAAP